MKITSGILLQREGETERYFLTEADARTYLADVVSLWSEVPSPEGWTFQPVQLEDVMVVTLRVENAYEDYDDVEYTVTNALIPVEPAADEQDYDADYSDARDAWRMTEIINPYTGVGCPDGDSWYDVEIIDCSVPSMVGRTFTFGY